MDINRLLSPDEAAPSRGSPQAPSPSPRKQRRPAGGKRTTSSLSQEVSRSPDRGVPQLAASNNGFSVPAVPQHKQYSPAQPATFSPANFRPLHQGPTSTPAVGGREAQTSYGYRQANAPQRPAIPHRNSSQSSVRSTSHIDALAGELYSIECHANAAASANPASLFPDVASMQRQPYPRTDSSSTVHSARAEQRSPSIATAAQAPPISRGISAQSLADLTMAEAPAQTPPPRTFSSHALSDTESQLVTELLGYLGEHSYAYDSHVQLIGLLHKGFLTHVYPPDGSDEPSGNPSDYSLLGELRQAREAMDSRFAVGEDIWLEWLSDEMLIAKSSEERISVTELFQKAVQDEPSSIAVWKAYADWVESNYAACNNLPDADLSGWDDEEREVCKELFTREMLVGTLEQALAATKWRIDQGHLLWNRYISLVQDDIGNTPSPQDLERLQNLFIDRLRIPSLGWEETAQMFWPLISKIHGDNWEAAMYQMNEMAEPAKVQMGLRDEHELKLQRAVDSGDKDEMFNEFSRYLKWEQKHGQKKRGPFDKDLKSALFERALLRFPTYTEWWLDYIDFVIGTMPSSHDPSSSMLPLLERATRHCPWSGELWGRRILRSDVERKPYHEIEAIKHRATNSGLLDVGGMEEMLKVLIEWCSYLRRNAFTSTSSEDDLDTAEVGITMAIEDVHQAGKKLYGQDFKGDPLYRLERIHMKFLGEARRFDDARSVYKQLSTKHHDSFEFWLVWYNWELLVWAHDRLSDSHRIETTETAPHNATAVVDEMLAQKNLDWPEKAVELYTRHFQHHESVERLQAAGIEAREFSKRLAIRRAREAEEAATAAYQQQQEQVAAVQAADPVETGAGDKRKREDESMTNGDSHKKTKTESMPTTSTDFGEPSASASAQIKRDRENCTITLTNLAEEVNETDVRKFFRDCGTIRSISMVEKSRAGGAAATVEFESVEDVATAKTRNGKGLKGSEAHIQSGTRSTLYVTNYPPEYDEAGIRKLLGDYGEIINVRFPSLKFNNRRRFCYVQFLNAEDARNASEAMDDKQLDGQHGLVAKISDPAAKANRAGATAEGREVFAKNIENRAPDDEVKQYFGQHGNMVSCNLIKRADGKRLGNGFFVYSTADEATRAVEAIDKKPFYNRIINATIATPREGAALAEKARKTDVIVKHSASPEPSAANGRRGSDVSMQSADAAGPGGEEMAKTVRERRVAILNVPDTVNDARIRAEMEKHGSIVKIQLRRDRDAAVVEFADIKVAFKVREGVDCSALGPDVRTGDFGEMFAKGNKKKQEGGATATAAGGFGGLKPAAISRPGQQRGGRRGGLGFKRGGGFGGASKNTSADIAASGDAAGNGNGSDDGAAAAAAKGNADFRAMFEQSREAKKDEEQ